MKPPDALEVALRELDLCHVCYPSVCKCGHVSRWSLAGDFE
jgi:hypothetical protein